MDNREQTGPQGMGQDDPLGRLEVLDRWMAEHPWHPRFVPFMVYGVMLLCIGYMREWAPASYPILYTLQCGLVVWLLWRYRRLLPELTLSFHWLAVPVGVGVFVAWIWLGKWMVATFPDRFADQGTDSFFDQMGVGVGWAAFSLRLIGMSIAVPLFEELFIRSLILRSLQHLKPTVIGALQIIQDLPLLGEKIMHTSWAKRADRHPPVFGREFDRTPLGMLSVFGVMTSTLIFASYHLPRDRPGCIVCGVAYCLLLAATRHKGLGPVCWAHGITNALLWVYTLQTGDWQFL